MRKYKTIGILGGMGPEATAELYKRIVQIYQRENGAVDDADFPNILINSVPAEDMLNDLANRKLVIIRQLQKAVRLLEQAGAEFVIIPCNTATIFLENMRSAVGIPILDITELTAQEAKVRGCQKVGLLASTSSIQTKIYENKLKTKKIDLVKPSASDQAEINQIIMRILAGNKSKSDKKKLLNIALKLRSQGALEVILGCTELPLLIAKSSIVPLLDTIEVLAEAAVKSAELTKKGAIL